MLYLHDGHEAAACATADILTMHGYTVHTARPGEEWKQALATFVPDCVLLELPAGQATQVCRSLRNHAGCERSRFIAVCDDGDEAALQGEGIARVLPSRASTRELLRALRP
ncbi:hypothetical protein [Ramlibacter aurantiacus]|uniref:hypothetical protein n=1 Tax=Ramlibacter aurantiacus TaxID=2801330 RepID=UPI001917D184|nr:hypothetical protein [Ramlibacter aurantiacus]